MAQSPYQSTKLISILRYLFIFFGIMKMNVSRSGSRSVLGVGVGYGWVGRSHIKIMADYCVQVAIGNMTKMGVIAISKHKNICDIDTFILVF